MTENWPPPEDDSPPAQPTQPPPDPATRAIDSAESPWGPPPPKPDRSYAPQRPPYQDYVAPQIVVAREITNPYATTGLVLGIIAACFFWVPVLNFILAALAIIFGGIGWYQARVRQTGRGKGIAGVTLGIVTMVGWFVFWAVVAASVGSSTAAALAAVPTTQDAIVTTSAAAPVAPGHHHRNATKHDFKVTLKVTDEQCFGYGAGCQIEYNAFLKYVGPASRKPAAHETYHVTYRVTGGNAGPIVASFLTDGAKADYQSGFVTTDNRSQKVHATVTSVEKYL